MNKFGINHMQSLGLDVCSSMLKLKSIKWTGLCAKCQLFLGLQPINLIKLLLLKSGVIKLIK